LTTTVVPSLGFELRRFLPTRLTNLSNRLARRATRLYGDRFKLSAAECRVLAILGHQGPVSATAVITETAMDKVRVSRSVATLLKAGLVTRETDPRDRRCAVLGLTASGRDLFGQIVPLVQEAEAEIMAALSDAERDALSDALGKIEGYLKQTGSEKISGEIES
jgi:DNA-binding MarR family transcriptional regulator